MSDAAVATIVSGVVTIATMVIGFLTLWLKMRYETKRASEAANKAADKASEAAKKAQVVEEKIDHNTEITARIEKQTNGPITDKFNQLEEHGSRIQILESRVEAVKSDISNLSRNLDSTRDEIRGQLDMISNNITMLYTEPRKTQEEKT